MLSQKRKKALNNSRKFHVRFLSINDFSESFPENAGKYIKRSFEKQSRLKVIY